MNRKERKGWLLPLIFLQSENFSFATLLEEMKPMTAVQHDFECRVKSKVVAYFGVFGLSRFWCEDKIDEFFCLSNFLLKFQSFGRSQDGRYQACSYFELRVSISRSNIINSIIWNMGLSVFQCKEQNRQYFHRECFFNQKVFDWDFDGRNKACRYGWQMRMTLKNEKIF